MTKRIFSYPDSAEQEAQGIRTLLEAHHIEFFETPASRWGFSNAAIWLKNDSDGDKVQTLLAQHHTEFAQQARQRYQMETGYDPNASWTVRARFTLKYLFQRKTVLVAVIVGFFLLYLYFNLFFSLFK